MWKILAVSAALTFASTAEANLHTPMMQVNTGLRASCTVVNFASPTKRGRLIMWDENGSNVLEARYDLRGNRAKTIAFDVEPDPGFPAPSFAGRRLRCTVADDSGSDSGLRLSMCQFPFLEYGVTGSCVSDER